jgi:hypothetical protein
MTNDDEDNRGCLAALCRDALTASDGTWNSVQRRLAECKEKLGHEDRARLEREIKAILSFQAPHFPTNVH